VRALRRLLGLDPDVDEARDTETVARIAAELDELPLEQARFLAAFAYVLARLARADLEISGAETREMGELVRKFSDLSAPQATLVVLAAKTYATTLGGTENYIVTRQFRELSNRAQRIDLMRCLFAVAAADQDISSVESAEITQIGNELGFTREEVAGLRAAFRDQLAVFKSAENRED
jgi:uncharacterized tellurite resistance protein B-like protein